MKRIGNTIIFEVVRHGPNANDDESLLMVNFDGEWTPYWCDKGMEVHAYRELEAYYREDWAGTGRVLTCLMYGQMRSLVIDCT